MKDPRQSGAARRWIAAIVGLLAGNAAAMVVLVAASAHGSSQVLPDYYRRAVAWDQVADAARASAALGWSVALEVHRDGDGAAVTATVRDRSGLPVTDAEARLSGFHRSHAAATRSATLIATAPGVYAGRLPAPEHGVHDLTLVLSRDPARFAASYVVDLESGGGVATPQPVGGEMP